MIAVGGVRFLADEEVIEIMPMINTTQASEGRKS
jgi:hypothetical protein